MTGTIGPYCPSPGEVAEWADSHRPIAAVRLFCTYLHPIAEWWMHADGSTGRGVCIRPKGSPKYVYQRGVNSVPFLGFGEAGRAAVETYPYRDESGRMLPPPLATNEARKGHYWQWVVECPHVVRRARCQYRKELNPESVARLEELVTLLAKNSAPDAIARRFSLAGMENLVHPTGIPAIGIELNDFETRVRRG